jgi:hypothetical protein
MDRGYCESLTDRASSVPRWEALCHKGFVDKPGQIPVYPVQPDQYSCLVGLYRISLMSTSSG